MWQFYRGVQRLATKNKCLLSFQTNRACSSNTAASGLPQEAPQPTKQEIAEISKQIPIEKKSLSSGLAVNKFEKDFVIYPEYEHALEIERIKKFVDELGSDLDKALVPESESSPGTMSPEVRQILLSYGVFASTVSQDFGGPGLGQKDMLQVSECLGGRDLSTFTSFNHVQMASNLIDQYGSLEQKERYLRGIANGKWRPTICYQEDTTGITPTAQVMSAPGQQDRLMTTKVNVVDAADANLFIVFANQQRGEIIIPSCYIIEKDAIDDPNASIQVKDQVKTSGLRRCNFSTVVFDNVPVDESLLLGEDDKVENLVEEIAYMRKTHCGAATVGFLKKVLAEICTFANTEVKGNLRLSDSHPVQKAIYDLGIQLYVLESASYYIAGLTDESLFLVQDIENSIIQKLSNQALRQAIMTITEVAGICSTDTELPYDKMIKDALAFMSLSEPDLHLVRRITLPAIEHYVNHYGGMKQFVKASAVTKWFTGRDDLESFLNPKFVHFIAEHVHPSLMDAARNFEFSIAQLSQVIDTLVTQKGVYINTDYVALQNISTIMENNLAMIATIARASRAYSIGVRNSDLEIDWTRFFCWKASEEVKKIILNTRELQTAGLFTPNPKLHTGAQSMLDMNGYSLESPIERNW